MVFPWGTILIGSLLAKKGPSKAELRAAEEARKRENRRATAATIRAEEAQAAREKLEAQRHAELIQAIRDSSSPISDAPEVRVRSQPKAPSSHQKSKMPDDPFSRVLNGRVLKRALGDVEELLAQDGMIEVVKESSSRIGGEKSLWHHPTGLYLVAATGKPARVFSRIADARLYRDRQS